MFKGRVRGKIRTPIHTLNIAGCGGFNTGTIIEAWGAPKAGKTTFSFQTAEMFLNDYGEDAVVVILDAELSADYLRLRRVFGIRPGMRINMEGGWEEIPHGDARVVHAPAMTVELAFSCISIAANYFKGKYILFIWDSITASQPKADWDDLQEKIANEEPVIELGFKGGMMAKPRALAKAFGNIMGIMWGNPKINLIIINQERVKIGQYVSGVYATGGKAKDHAIHYSLYFKFEEKLEENEYFKKGTSSTVTIEKSKFMPYVSNIPIFIYDTLGGKLSPPEELLSYAAATEAIVYKKGWYSIPGVEKQMQMAKAVLSDEAIKHAHKAVEGMFRENFQLVNWEYEELAERRKAAKARDTKAKPKAKLAKK